jgi:hypothetical protein
VKVTLSQFGDTKLSVGCTSGIYGGTPATVSISEPGVQSASEAA